MGLPRSRYVKEGEEGVYHCFSRCVRRAFLCGYDPLTGRDFSHRKKLIVDRLRHLAAVFAIEVCAYAIMENHSHVILRLRPDIVAAWSDQEVATRWLELFPQKRRIKGKPIPPLEEQIQALADCPERIAVLRKRLCSLSWFMGQLNEFIARAANKEDKVTGRFWEGRFKSQALLDDAATAACMVYVDLNLIRARMAATPEESDYTSIQERIRCWQKETMASDSDSGEEIQAMRSVPAGEESSENIATATSKHISTASASSTHANSWLCPIQSDSTRRGILQMSTSEYFDLLDRSGRMVRADKRGYIDADLEPILKRIGAVPKAWVEIVSHFGSAFWLVAGSLSNMRNFADSFGKCWFKGVTTARSVFAS
jgi:putative transposase